MSVKNTTSYFECACNSLKHLIKVEYYEEDNEVIFSFCLNPNVPWWKRFVVAAKYLFTPHSVSGFGDYDCVILNNKKDCERLANLLNRVHD